jgi:hypothetical protein
MMEILLAAIGALVTLDLLAHRYGAESRDGFDDMRSRQPKREHVTPGGTTDAELARQLLENRCSRACSTVVGTFVASSLLASS